MCSVRRMSSHKVHINHPSHSNDILHLQMIPGSKRPLASGEEPETALVSFRWVTFCCLNLWQTCYLCVCLYLDRCLCCFICCTWTHRKLKDDATVIDDVSICAAKIVVLNYFHLFLPHINLCMLDNYTGPKQSKIISWLIPWTFHLI